MSSLATRIREGLKTRVGTVSGLTAHAVFPGQITPPCAIVSIQRWEYHQTMGMGGDNRVSAEVIILAAAIGQGQEKAQAALDDYLDSTGTNSVKQAIEGDKTLGGVVQTLIVSGWAEYGEVEVNGLPYLGAVLNVEVWTL